MLEGGNERAMMELEGLENVLHPGTVSQNRRQPSML
jgi:hypothetical protein